MCRIKNILWVFVVYAPIFQPSNAQTYSVHFDGEMPKSVEKRADTLVLITDQSKYYSVDGLSFQTQPIAYHGLRNFKYSIEDGNVLVREPYQIALDHVGVSVRANGRNYVAGYDYVEIEGTHIPNIPYCSGAVKVLDGRYYVCFDGLAIVNPQTFEFEIYNSKAKATFEIAGCKSSNKLDF